MLELYQSILDYTFVAENILAVALIVFGLAIPVIIVSLTATGFNMAHSSKKYLNIDNTKKNHVIYDKSIREQILKDLEG